MFTIKKTWFILFCITIIFAGCETNSDNSPGEDKNINKRTLYSDHIQVTSIGNLDGEVNSNFIADTTSTTMTVGMGYTMLYKGIVTFNTSEIPDNKQVTKAYLSLYSTNWFACGGVSDDWDMGLNSLAIEIAGPYGFNNTWAITGLDYAAPAMGIGIMKSYILYDTFEIANADLNKNTHLLPLISKTGLTQMRVSLASHINQPCALEVFTGESSCYTKPVLYVYFE